MPALQAEEVHLDEVDDFLEGKQRLQHLRARKRGACIIIESGPKTDACAHARLRRVSAQQWALEMPDHRDRWEPTPFVDRIEPLLQSLVDEFAWTLQPVDQGYRRTR